MKSERFNRSPQEYATSDAVIRKHTRWTRMLELGSIPDSTSSGRKRVFAVILPPVRAAVSDKIIRRVLIFDNHPETLRLLVNSGIHLDNDDAESRSEKRKSIICGAILIALVLAALLWAFLS
jgi:hypothetical protein